MTQEEILRDYEDFFRDFTRSAFRLEMHPQYVVEFEKQPFEDFRAGRLLSPPRDGVLAEWEKTIMSNRAANKSMQRIRLLPEPMTPYVRFEIEWAYLYTATAGEDIRLIPADAHPEVRVHAKEDFWLFDDKTVFFLKYDQDGRFQGVEKSEEMPIVQGCRDLREMLLPYAISLRDYLISIRNS